ncbi:hypothetical protein KAR91_02135 [Candidatus Pacearchaeota archaeon]|nr:hypothetical protein [Candidatus Pacearchaeota archaeon]
MNLLDLHAESLKINVDAIGRPIALIEPDDTIHLLTGIYNMVEHGLKIEDLENPIGEKSNIYIDRDSLQLEAGEIEPKTGWRLSGSPNMYETDKTYFVEIDESDRQLPGILLFLTTINPTATKWTGEE